MKGGSQDKYDVQEEGGGIEIADDCRQGEGVLISKKILRSVFLSMDPISGV